MGTAVMQPSSNGVLYRGVRQLRTVVQTSAGTKTSHMKHARWHVSNHITSSFSSLGCCPFSSINGYRLVLAAASRVYFCVCHEITRTIGLSSRSSCTASKLPPSNHLAPRQAAAAIHGAHLRCFPAPRPTQRRTGPQISQGEFSVAAATHLRQGFRRTLHRWQR